MNLNEVAKEIRNILSERQKELCLTFEEDNHKYTMKDVDGTIKSDFPSVSKVMKLFYDEFPTEEAARRKAKGDPYVMQTLIEEWAEAGKASTNLGSRVHYELEMETIKMFGLEKEVRQPIYECDYQMIVSGDKMINAGKRFLNLMKERGAEILDTEIVLGHPELGYTGQPDKVWLMFDKPQKNIGIVVTDWKSNKKKNMEVNNFTKPMRTPFEFLPNNALGHYNTQLPLYGKLLLKMLEGTKYENLKFFGCVVVHLTDEQEYTEHRVPRKVVDIIMDMDIKSKLTKLKK